MIADDIRARIEAALSPDQLVIRDDSAQHAGHAGAREGGHFTVEIVAPVFQNLTRVARHRLVYDSVADLMRGKIHALAIVALTPAEAHRISRPKTG